MRRSVPPHNQVHLTAHNILAARNRIRSGVGQKVVKRLVNSLFQNRALVLVNTKYKIQNTCSPDVILFCVTKKKRNINLL